MGYTSWSSTTYDSIKTDYKSKDTDTIFKANKTRRISPDMDPSGLKNRECRDSDAHPLSLAIQFWLDETGSMGEIPDYLIRNKLGTLIETLLKHKVTDPSVLFGGIGDHYSDHYPLQIGQFESGTEELNKWLTSVYLEGSGGGQNKESYLLAWLIAGRYTSIDCFEKRGKKGYLFTVGDEKTWDSLSGDVINNLLGENHNETVTAEQLLSEANRLYNVYHIHINSTRYKNDPDVINSWKELLGQNLIILDDEKNVAEVVASTIAVMEGANKSDVLLSFDPKTALSVSNALVSIDDKSLVKSDSKVIKF